LPYSGNNGNGYSYYHPYISSAPTYSTNNNNFYTWSTITINNNQRIYFRAYETNRIGQASVIIAVDNDWYEGPTNMYSNISLVWYSTGETAKTINFTPKELYLGNSYTHNIYFFCTNSFNFLSYNYYVRYFRVNRNTNDAPQDISFPTKTTSVVEGTGTVSFTYKFYDRENDTCSSKYRIDSGELITLHSNIYSFSYRGNTYPKSFNAVNLARGTHSVTVYVYDSNSLSASGSFSFTVTRNYANNLAPVLSITQSSSTIVQGANIQFTIRMNDAEGDTAAIYYSINNQNDWVSITTLSSGGSTSKTLPTSNYAINQMVTVYFKAVETTSGNTNKKTTIESKQFQVLRDFSKNAKPTINVATSKNPIYNYESISFTVTHTDADRDPVNVFYSLDGASEIQILNNMAVGQNVVQSFNPNTFSFGSHTIKFRIAETIASNFKADEKTITFTVNRDYSRNNAPSVTMQPATIPTTYKTHSITFTFSATDAENDPVDVQYKLDNNAYRTLATNLASGASTQYILQCNDLSYGDHTFYFKYSEKNVPTNVKSGTVSRTFKVERDYSVNSPPQITVTCNRLDCTKVNDTESITFTAKHIDTDGDHADMKYKIDDGSFVSAVDWLMELQEIVHYHLLNYYN
jgi:hypothetical protein